MIASALAAEYRKARAPMFSSYGAHLTWCFPAQQAMQQAQQALRARAVEARWGDQEGSTIYQYDPHIDNAPSILTGDPGLVRLRLVCDEACYDDSFIDTWHDVSERERETYRTKLWVHINRDGVWGVIGEYWHHGAWHQADSCFGFVGDDWRGSGYDTDIMQATLDALSEVHAEDARHLEEERSDMTRPTNSDLTRDLVAALEATVNALAQIDDFGSATEGGHPDEQNSALDNARAVIAKAQGDPS